MNYTIQIHPDFTKQMKKLDPHQAKLIYYWIEKHLVNKDPRTKGKAITPDYFGSWKYNLGGYRIIAHIFNNSLEILTVSHRSQSYR